ncbi:MAG: lysozyme inhibitor LprI family protein [Pseudobdellovibrionaceae bacterium]
MFHTKTIAILFFAALLGTAWLAGTAEARKAEDLTPYLHAGFCDEITSTADALTCLTDHKNSAEARLKEISAAYLKELDEDQVKAFTESEAAWVSFRDKSCALEKSTAEGTILQQLALTSCVAIETDHRASRLAHMVESDGTRRMTFGEYGLLPRWLNSVLKQDRDIFWTSRRALETDLNCDGRKEQFLTGLAVADSVPAATVDADTDEKTIKPLTYDAQVALALATDPEVGRPDILVLRVPVQSALEEGQLALCSDKIAVTLIPVEGAEADPVTSCTSQEILISAPTRPDCAAIRLGLGEDGKPTRLENGSVTN